MPAFEISPGLREMSREELGRFRRGELSTAEVAAWLERTRGLDAPEPPGDGDLPPNRTGWLVGVKPQGGRLHPGLPVMVVCWAAAAVLFATCAGLFAWQHRPSLTLAALLGALIPLTVVVVLELAARYGMERRFARAARPARVADAAPGSVVCLEGVIAMQPSVSTLFRGVPAVLFRDCVHNADEVRGVDFDLDLDDGQRAHVCVRRAFLADRPTPAPQAPACGPVYAEPASEGFSARLRSALLVEPSPVFQTLGARYESSVGPGDRVEVAGVLHQELAPDAAAPFDRFPPSRFVLRAGAHQPLLVRRLTTE